MKSNLCEYYPDGTLRHQIVYYSDGCKFIETFFIHGSLRHQIVYYSDGGKFNETFFMHGYIYNNIYNPYKIAFLYCKKILAKRYNINGEDFGNNKLTWQNQIKNI